MELIKDGRINSLILYSSAADATDETAVAEYSLFLRFCTDKDHPCSTVLQDDYKNYVLIGANNPYAEQFGVKVPLEKFTSETIYIAVKGNVVVLDGGERGKLYAVYEFLERFLGVRFYAPEAYKCPKIKNLEIADCEIIYTPPIRFRNLYSYDVRWNREFCARMRSNSENVPMGLKHFGGSLSWAKPDCHTTFKVFFPPYDTEVGVAVHPEYYAWRKDQNKRVARFHSEYGFPWGEGEICWSNKEVRKILVKRLKRWILEEPQMTVFSITQNDWGEYCECDECQKVAYEHGKNGKPALSAPVLDAVNEVAREIAKWQKTDERVKDRDIFVETFAYNYTRSAPVGMRAEKNVIVRYCASGCRFHSFEDKCVLNEQFKAEFEEWQKVADNIFVWDYMANGCMAVAYNTFMRVMPDRFKFFAEHKIIGMFAQSEAYGPIGPLFKANQYLLAKLLWNPYIDYQKEYAEFMDYYFEDAAPYLMEVQRRYEEAMAELDKQKLKEDGAGLHFNVSFMMFPEYYPDDFLTVADSLYTVALSRVKKAEVKLRVRKEFWYLKFARMYKRRGVDYVEMQAVLDEMDELGITFDKVKIFKEHYYGGRKDDLFLPSIEDRNRRAALEKILDITRG